jgi:hypothetical protein
MTLTLEDGTSFECKEVRVFESEYSRNAEFAGLQYVVEGMDGRKWACTFDSGCVVKKSEVENG